MWGGHIFPLPPAVINWRAAFRPGPPHPLLSGHPTRPRRSRCRGVREVRMEEGSELRPGAASRKTRREVPQGAAGAAGAAQRVARLARS